MGAMTVCIVAVFATILIMLLLSPIARLLGADAQTLPYVKGYLGVIVLFLPFYMTS